MWHYEQEVDGDSYLVTLNRFQGDVLVGVSRLEENTYIHNTDQDSYADSQHVRECISRSKYAELFDNEEGPNSIAETPEEFIERELTPAEPSVDAEEVMERRF